MSRIDINGYIEQVYRETSSYLIKYITLKCRSTEDIQDILQNTYLGFIDTVANKGYTGIFNPKHYLLRIAKREIAKFYEDKSEHDNVVVASTDDEDYVEKSLDEFLEHDFTGDHGFSVEVWDRIESFGALTAKIFTLRFVYEETIERIAKQLDMTPSNVKNHLYRGLKALKDEMLCGRSSK
jgi:RNA polymerase sigma factor (sigma-70 family)